MKTASQFAFGCLDIKPILPLEKEKSDGKICWLCGGHIEDGTGWKIKKAILSTFTNHNQAKALTSSTVCFQCVTFSRVESWIKYVNSLETTSLKISKVTSWRSYSHVFSKHGHQCPTRKEWKDILLNPPDPPFLFVVAISGQKHLIFRSKISYNQNTFYVKFEDEDLVISKSEFTKCLVDFEAMYELGFSKISILKGDYNQAQIIKVGLNVWLEAENKIKIWRNSNQDIIRLVKFCAQKEKEDEGK